MTDAFSTLIEPNQGRIVNVGSGGGAMYVAGLVEEEKHSWQDKDQKWEDILARIDLKLTECDEGFPVYKMSKAAMHSYTIVSAKQQPDLKINVCSPGFIDTKMTKGMGASLTAEQGTKSIIHLLFGALKGNGQYYGSDALRSPFHMQREPGSPEYDGE